MRVSSSESRAGVHAHTMRSGPSPTLNTLWRGAGRDERAVALADQPLLAVDDQPALTGCYEIQLLGEHVVVLAGGAARRDGGLGEALVLGGRRYAPGPLADLRAVERDERFDVRVGADVHRGESPARPRRRAPERRTRRVAGMGSREPTSPTRSSSPLRSSFWMAWPSDSESAGRLTHTSCWAEGGLEQVEDRPVRWQTVAARSVEEMLGPRGVDDPEGLCGVASSTLRISATASRLELGSGRRST